MFSSFALAALAAAQADSGVKWVPLKPDPPQQQQEAEPSPQVQPSAPAAPQESAPPTAAQAVSSPPTVGQQPLHLTCLGSGVASKATGAAVWGYGGWATVAGKKDRGFADQVDVTLFNGDDRIRMPRTMLPGIRGGREGWFKLKNVNADARSIRASAAVNALNNPKVFIDRVTGTISISGKSGDYSGQCEVIDATTAPKF